MQNAKSIDYQKRALFEFDSYPINEKGRRKARLPYASATMSLLFATICTRPDIYFPNGLANRFQSNHRYASGSIQEASLISTRNNEAHALLSWRRHVFVFILMMIGVIS